MRESKRGEAKVEIRWKEEGLIAFTVREMRTKIRLTEALGMEREAGIGREGERKIVFNVREIRIEITLGEAEGMKRETGNGRKDEEGMHNEEDWLLSGKKRKAKGETENRQKEDKKLRARES